MQQLKGECWARGLHPGDEPDGPRLFKGLGEKCWRPQEPEDVLREKGLSVLVAGRQESGRGKGLDRW